MLEYPFQCILFLIVVEAKTAAALKASAVEVAATKRHNTMSTSKRTSEHFLQEFVDKRKFASQWFNASFI